MRKEKETKEKRKEREEEKEEKEERRERRRRVQLTIVAQKEVAERHHARTERPAPLGKVLQVVVVADVANSE